MIDTDQCPYCHRHTLKVSTFEQHFHFVECDHYGARGPRVLNTETPFIGLKTLPCGEKSTPNIESVNTSSDIIAKNKSLEQMVKDRTHAL